MQTTQFDIEIRDISAIRPHDNDLRKTTRRWMPWPVVGHGNGGQALRVFCSNLADMGPGRPDTAAGLHWPLALLAAQRTGRLG